MLIGIEASRANRQKKTGVEWYAYFLIQKLKSLTESQKHSWLLYSNTPLAMGLERGPSNWHETRLSWFPKYLWTQIRLSFEMWRRSPEVLFVPAHVLPRVIPKRTVVTIHDIGFHHFPELYKPIQRWYHEWSTRDILHRASRIITVSEFSKRELVESYYADASKIFVTHLGIDHERYQPLSAEQCEPILQKFRVPKPFVLFIGRLERKKNVATLVKAFHRYKEVRGIGDPMQLVLVGQPGVGYQEIEEAIRGGESTTAIHLLGYASEEEKVALLSSATALIHPSLYEGFGLTPLEAMACGLPVICSHAGSLPEVVGIENALWFDPGDVDALVRALGHLIDDPSLGATLRERGLAWCQRYTWQQTAEQTLLLLTDFV